MAQPNPIEIATRALEHRDRSRREIDDRLVRAGVEDEARVEALAELERAGYIDDARFAGLRARELAGRGYGDEYIRFDLVGHRVPPDDVAEAIAGLEPETERAAALVARLGRTRKTGATLARKGFETDAIQSALGTDVADTAG